MAHRRAAGRPMVKHWTSLVVLNQAITTTQAIFATAALEHGEDATLLRSRGEFIFVATPNAGADFDVIGIGLIVVQSAAVTVGGAAVPGPINDGDADWLWHQFVPLDAGGASAADPNAIGLFARVTVDSKAMRKVRTDQTIILVAELSTGNFTDVAFSGGVRLLEGK